MNIVLKVSGYILMLSSLATAMEKQRYEFNPENIGLSGTREYMFFEACKNSQHKMMLMKERMENLESFQGDIHKLIGVYLIKLSLSMKEIMLEQRLGELHEFNRIINKVSYGIYDIQDAVHKDIRHGGSIGNYIRLPAKIGFWSGTIISGTCLIATVVLTGKEVEDGKVCRLKFGAKACNKSSTFLKEKNEALYFGMLVTAMPFALGIAGGSYGAGLYIYDSMAGYYDKVKISLGY